MLKPWFVSGLAPGGLIQAMARKKTKEGVAFGKALRNERDDRGVTQEQLGELSGLHPKYISLMERGLRQPTLTTILQLATALEIEASTLIEQVEKHLRTSGDS